MNKLLLLIISLFSVLNCCAQSPFQNISFEKALKKAAKENKLIFLQFQSDDCIQCNEVADKAFADVTLSSKVSEEYIPIKIAVNDKLYNDISNRYDIKYGSLFIDEKGELVHAVKMTTTNTRHYFEQMKIADEKRKIKQSLAGYEKKYFDAPVKNIRDLETLIAAKNSLNESTDLLLTEYINVIPQDSLKTVRTIKFIANQSPLVNSKAFTAMRNDGNLFSRAWYELDLQKRIDLNNNTINKSMKKAISERDENYAINVSQFAAGTTDKQKADETFNSNLSFFYKQIKDTIKYLKTSFDYYEKVYASATNENLARLESQAKEIAFKNPRVENVKPIDGAVRTRYVTSFVNPSSTISNTLNSGAWDFYTYDRNNKYILHSLDWAKRSIEIFENPYNLDTYARLLCKAGKINDAIQTEERAIALSKKNGLERKEWHVILEKMKASQPLE